MERRFLPRQQQPIRIEKRAEGDGPPRIVGYAAVYYDGTEGTEFRIFDDLVERILPGAFDRAIREDDVRGVFNHNPDHIMGRNTASTMKLSVDSVGLRYEITPPDTELARSVIASIERGDVSGSSFAFRVVAQVFRQEEDIEIREIEEVELFDVGPVTFPAYTSTQAETLAASVRAADVEDARKALEAHRAARQRKSAEQVRSRFARQARARMVEIETADSA